MLNSNLEKQLNNALAESPMVKSFIESVRATPQAVVHSNCRSTTISFGDTEEEAMRAVGYPVRDFSVRPLFNKHITGMGSS